MNDDVLERIAESLEHLELVLHYTSEAPLATHDEVIDRLKAPLG